MTSGFPRLLVATEFPPSGAGGGLVLVKQMLRGWPVDRLHWWSCRPLVSQATGQPVASHCAPFLPSKLYPNRRYIWLRTRLMRYCWAPMAAVHLKRLIRACRPDVIWVISHNWCIPPVSKVLLGGNVPFHVSMHDYADVRSMVECVGLSIARDLAGRADRLYAQAVSRDAICAAMVEDLHKRTGARGTICRVGVEPDDLEFLKSKRSQFAGEIRIAFAGTIISPQAFEFFIKALAGVRMKLQFPIKLEFFGAHSQRDRSWFDEAWMRERRNLPDMEFRSALRDCSWGVSPMAVSDDDARYHRFSFPAKISSYLAAGLPVIALAHPEGSLPELFGRYDIGLCSTTPNMELFQRKLLDALSVREPWARHGEEVIRCAQEEFNAANMREKFHDSLRSIAAHGAG